MAGCALFYRSLVGGFSIPQIVEVLRASRYLVPSHFASSTSMGHEMAFQSVKAMQRDRKLAEERLFKMDERLPKRYAIYIYIYIAQTRLGPSWTYRDDLPRCGDLVHVFFHLIQNCSGCLLFLFLIRRKCR